MRHWITAAIACALALPLAAQDASEPLPSPTDIINSAPTEDWLVIEPEDLLVMTLAPDAAGNARRVVIQLMPAPFSQGWADNIRTLARAEWYDGISVNRVQDNYVVQWGDPGYDNPESGETEQKPLPEGLRVMDEEDYVVDGEAFQTFRSGLIATARKRAEIEATNTTARGKAQESTQDGKPALAVPATLPPLVLIQKDNYAPAASFLDGWPVAFGSDSLWPVHCYGMVGVGRNYSPDTGSGAELYTVIGHAPRHLDRNIALAGRVIDGIEHLSSLPRGNGVLGFYTEDEADKRVSILSVRVASDLSPDEQPQFEYLSTQSRSFADYAAARSFRLDAFFVQPADGADLCNIPVPIRAFEYTD